MPGLPSPLDALRVTPLAIGPWETIHGFVLLSGPVVHGDRESPRSTDLSGEIVSTPELF